MTGLTKPTSKGVVHDGVLLHTVLEGMESDINDLNPTNRTYDYLSTIVNKDKSPKDNIRSFQDKLPTQPTRFATWNLWGGYSTEQFFDNDRQSPRKTKLLQEQFLDAQVDYFGFQECFVNPAIRVNYLSVPPLNNAFFGMSDDAGRGEHFGNMTLTRFTPINSYSKVYDDQTPTSLDIFRRSYIRERLPNGITAYTTHLSTDPARVTNMLAELLIEVNANGGSKIVLMGDFNTSNPADLAAFESAGFTIVNKANWGSSIDRLLVKGLTITGFNKVQILGKGSQLSDHDMYYVDVQ